MSHQTILHRTMRPLVGRLAGTPISPDALTVLRLATGLGAASCFACGSRRLAIGAGLFLVSMLLDRADGELARRSGRFSRFGSRFDLVADCVSNMAAFVGLGLAPSWTTPWIAYAMGLLAAASTASIFLRLNGFKAGGATGALPCRPFDPDDALLLVPVVVWRRLFDPAGKRRADSGRGAAGGGRRSGGPQGRPPVTGKRIGLNSGA